MVLTEGGLQPALRALVERSSIPARLTDVPDRRFPAGVEAAVYFVVAEALTNAARYSDASAVEVCATQRDGRLRVVITDDGRGEADPAGLGRARDRR